MTGETIVMDGGRMIDPPRRCIVLGGSGALGRVVCASLAAEGARVGFTFHRSRSRGARARLETGGHLR